MSARAKESKLLRGQRSWDAPRHVNTSHNAGPLSRRLPTMRSLLRYRCIVAAAFAPAMPSSSTMPLASHCFTLAVCARAGERERRWRERAFQCLRPAVRADFYPDRLLDLPPSFWQLQRLFFFPWECISVDAGDIARTVSLLEAPWGPRLCRRQRP